MAKFQIGQSVAKIGNKPVTRLEVVRHDPGDDTWLVEAMDGGKEGDRTWVDEGDLTGYLEAIEIQRKKDEERAERERTAETRAQAMKQCCDRLSELVGTRSPVTFDTFRDGSASFTFPDMTVKRIQDVASTLSNRVKYHESLALPTSVNGMVAALMAHVQASMNQRQQLTTFSQQVAFLVTEVGEVQKELLKADGVYGATAQVGAVDRAVTELQDCLWNVLAAFVRIGAQPDFACHLKDNAERVWPSDPLTEKQTGEDVKRGCEALANSKTGT